MAQVDDLLSHLELDEELIAALPSSRTSCEGLATIGLNPGVREGRIASHQYKDPFGVLEMDSSGALCQSWWALEDLNL